MVDDEEMWVQREYLDGSGGREKLALRWSQPRLLREGPRTRATRIFPAA